MRSVLKYQRLNLPAVTELVGPSRPRRDLCGGRLTICAEKLLLRFADRGIACTAGEHMTRAISLITALSRPSQFFWRHTARSVLKQTNPEWRWLIVADLPPGSGAGRRLQSIANADSRVTVEFVPQHAAQRSLSNEFLSAIGSEFVGLLEPHASLGGFAIEDVLNALGEHPQADVVYGDEQRFGRFGRIISQTRRPAWSPERLNGQMYLGEFVVYRTELVQRVVRESDLHGEALVYDLALRTTEQAREILRIAKPLVQVKSPFPSGSPRGKNQELHETAELIVLRNHLKRISVKAKVEPAGYSHSFLVTRDVTRAKPVSVIIPTRGSAGVVFGQRRVFVTELIRSLIQNSAGLDVEFVVVYDTDTPAEVIADLNVLADENLQLVSFTESFNFSSKCNAGAVHASHEQLVFLNDDMQCLSENALAQLTVVLDEPGVGMTGAKLFFEDGTIQHGGHVHDYGDNRINYYGTRAESPGRDGALLINREASGVTGACMAMTRSVFTEVGGFSEQFPNSYNDVDLCNKVRGAGYRILWLATVRMFHFESKSRVPVVAAQDYELIHTRWGSAPDEFFA